MELKHNSEDLYSKLKSDRKKHLILITVLIFINIILFTFLIKGGRGLVGNFLAALNANLFAFNVLGFVLGVVIALFPYKKLPYKKKYLRASLLTILTIQSIMTIGFILIGIMTLMGWY